MMQFHEVLEPVFERLGVFLDTRNYGMGGLGTFVLLRDTLGCTDIH
jgi:hypothetical protein